MITRPLNQFRRVEFLVLASFASMRATIWSTVAWTTSSGHDSRPLTKEMRPRMSSMVLSSLKFIQTPNGSS